MTMMTAEDAARYALQRANLYLVTVAIIGGVLIGIGIPLAMNAHGPPAVVIPRRLIGSGVTLAGIVLQVAGGIGLVYKVISDATSNRDAQ